MRNEQWHDAGDAYVLILQCARCEAWLPPEDFPANPRMRRGRGSWCKPCQAASNRRWRAENGEAINVDRRAAYAAAKGGPVRNYTRHADPDPRLAPDAPGRLIRKTGVTGPAR